MTPLEIARPRPSGRASAGAISNGVTRWLSRRHPRYIRSLVYMLQASEYNIGDFFRWHERVRDFRSVEKRKQLVFSAKATALLVFGWVVLLFMLIGAVIIFLSVSSPWNYVLSALLLLEAPLVVMVGLLLAVASVRVIQGPFERFIVACAKKRLAEHRGVKIAIAGSFGKTSMREVLKTVLSEGKKVAAPPDSYNTPLSIARFVRGLKGDEDVLIFELGEYYPGDVRALARAVQPTWGFVTGVNEAHLEKFKTLERTTGTIFELAEFVDASRLYVNGESALARSRAKSSNVLYTREGAGDWRIENPETGLLGTTFMLTKNGAMVRAHSGLCGLHSLGVLAAAADIASRLGLTNAEIERGLARTKPFAHRLEPKQWPDKVTFIDDSYNGNPDGARAAIEFLSSLQGRRWYVTPGLVEGGARAKDIHEEIGRTLAAAGIEKVALIRTSVAHHIEAGLNEGGFNGEMLWYSDMPACLAALRASALPGDIILVQNDWPDQYA